MSLGDMILKYPVDITGPFTHRMPIGAKILDVQMQGAYPQIWARVNGANDEVEPRSFMIVGTGPGHAPIDDRFVYVGTFQMAEGKLVWHLFEIKAAD